MDVRSLGIQQQTVHIGWSEINGNLTIMHHDR